MSKNQTASMKTLRIATYNPYSSFHIETDDQSYTGQYKILIFMYGAHCLYDQEIILYKINVFSLRRGYSSSPFLPALKWLIYFPRFYHNLHRRNLSQRLRLILAPVLSIPNLQIVNHRCNVTLGSLLKECVRDLV